MKKNISLLVSFILTLCQPVQSKVRLTKTSKNERDIFAVPQELSIDGEIALEPSHEQPAPPTEPLKPYTIQNVLQTVPYFHDTFAVVVYDPSSDTFIAHYSNNMRWISGCHKLVKSIKTVVSSLRQLYPERFTPNNSEFAFAVSSADYPGVAWTDCIRAQRDDCIETELSPILHFGSVFQRQSVFSTMMGMPMPYHNHLECYHYWVVHGQPCNFYLPRTDSNPYGLVFPETIGLEYDDLIPQVVWRGTDFSYLHNMHPELRKPEFDMDIASQIDLSNEVDPKISATHAIREIYDELIPRWKGVVWTAEAEREAESSEGEPWCNIKFAFAFPVEPTTYTEYYRQFEEYGIPAMGERMSLETLGQYKYHIDIGGGGGTTWSGTLEKLGLPGLLFHHVTPTKDYFHDKLQPWVHYVPVKADLSDLKEKYDWAESHPLMAKRISDNATQFIRWLGTAQGMDEMFHQFYSWPLQRVVEAYVALEEGHDWREYMPDELRPIMQCDGFHDCEKLVHDIKFTVHDRDVDSSV